MTDFRFHPQSQVVQQQDSYLITLYTAINHPYSQIFVRVEPDHEEWLIELKKPKQEGNWLKWQTKIPVSPHSPLTLYCFKFLCQDQQVFLHAAGESSRLPQKHFHFKINHNAKPPAWVKQQVFYQIFPERFANGDPNLTPTDDSYSYHRDGRAVVQKKWGEPVAKSHSGTGATEFYGGDLIGIEQKLDYLDELGVTAIYLNPIFCSPSNHKYDCSNYFKVEPHFGGDDALISLSANMKQRGMKLMLDAVVNHTSNQHHWMDYYQQGMGGAYHNSDSLFKDWYHFDDSGNYWSWKGVETLPKLNFANLEVQKAIYSSEQSVLKHWLKPPFSIDAWRFDVIHMLGEHNSAQNNAHYVAEFRKSIKETNPDAYMIGEHFAEATQWLQGDQEDAAMNYYGFNQPIVAFLAKMDVPRYSPIKLDAKGLAEWLAESRGSIPFANQLAQYNLLDSHDTPRFSHLVNDGIDLNKVAATLLLTYVGVPSIYYGDEVGVTGANDPDCRRCFPWDESQWQQPLLAHYQQLIALRKHRKEFQEGDIISLLESDDVWAFIRWLPKHHSIVVINRGDAANITLNLSNMQQLARYRLMGSIEELQPNQQQLSLSLEAQSSLILSSI
ncbi:maltodextrin glucosidase [Agarivorans sp. Toyoura001]|uniref:maltodextrin glucosidase n=1 Tax=Agarivorans sp. Toyoura001 TaxID=2283141 RepID=UPI0010D206B5|nr:maltodextrin glucosidase [Agarivorans sp. Toyoura001]GDY27437.1 maltodextrin glucosidase [Agarivorans sp. Toyoura001]